MKEIRICIVCGSKFLKQIRKDSKADLCSANCRAKYSLRKNQGLPISNIEFEKGKAERRRKANFLKDPSVKILPLTKTEEDGSAYLCNRADCRYRAHNNPHTCDYMLITGKDEDARLRIATDICRERGSRHCPHGPQWNEKLLWLTFLSIYIKPALLMRRL